MKFLVEARQAKSNTSFSSAVFVAISICGESGDPTFQRRKSLKLQSFQLGQLLTLAFATVGSVQAMAAVKENGAKLPKDDLFCVSFLNEPDARLAACRRALAQPSNAKRIDLLFAQAGLLEEAGRLIEAIAVADRIVSIKSGGGSGYNSQCWLRGVANVELKRAAASCNEAVRLMPESDDVLDSAGLVSLRQKEWAKAWDYYDRAVRIRPSATHIYGRGLAALATGRSSDAQKDLWEGRFAATTYQEMKLDPFVISALAGGETNTAHSSVGKLTAPVRLSSNVQFLQITVDGQVVSDWQLIRSRIPDVSDIIIAPPKQSAEVCLKTTIAKACQTLRKGAIGVFIIRYKGEDYLAHFES